MYGLHCNRAALQTMPFSQVIPVQIDSWTDMSLRISIVVHGYRSHELAKMLGRWRLTWFGPRVAGKVSNPAAMVGDNGCMQAMLLVWPELHLHHCIGVHLEGSYVGQGVCFGDLCHHPVQQMNPSLLILSQSLPCHVGLVVVIFLQDFTSCLVL